MPTVVCSASAERGFVVTDTDNPAKNTNVYFTTCTTTVTKNSGIFRIASFPMTDTSLGH